VIGTLFWMVSGRPLLFISFLAVLFIYILVLSIRLLRLPVKARAEQFYLAGFVFFLLPLVGLLIDNYVGFRP
jgi:hypothetical protein